MDLLKKQLFSWVVCVGLNFLLLCACFERRLVNHRDFPSS